MKNVILISGLMSLMLLTACKKEEDKPSACFKYSFGLQVNNSMLDTYCQFENCSENAKTYSWKFGDGTTSNEENPKHFYESDGAYWVELKVSNESGTDTFGDSVHFYGAIAEKPNIYLYPEYKTTLCVSLDFPKGGSVVKSLPDYGSGWCVEVEPDGTVNGQFGYLYYESIQPDNWQTQKGWCVSQEELHQFFTDNLSYWNFNAKEIEDFNSYWIPIFNSSPYYLIYPQTNELINSMITLNISIKPDNIGRLFYVIKSSNEFKSIEKPDVVPFVRKGFTVMEWGVIRSVR